jgi:hypothetical protein
MDSFSNQDKANATEIITIINLHHTWVYDATKLVDNLVYSVSWLTKIADVLAVEGWIMLLCYGTTVLYTVHSYVTPTPCATKDVIACQAYFGYVQRLCG